MPTLNLGMDARGMRAGANEATAATDKVQRGAKGAAEATGRLEAQFKSTGAVAGALKKTVGGLFAGLTAFTVLRQAVKVIADFELTMRTLQGVSGATAEEFELLESAARKLGATTKFSATEAAEGLLFLARAGFSTQQSLDAINATLQLAQVGLIDLGQAADIASNVVKGFQLEAKETSRVAEGLVIVANRSNTNITALAEAMKFAAPVAASLGISFEEAAAAVGAMGDAGIPAGMAGRSLRGIFRGLVAPTSEATKTLKEMGITLDEVNPEKVGLTAAFERLNAAGAGFKEMLAIVGTESVTAAIVLADSTDTMDMLVEATGAAKGELEALAAAMNDTIPGAFKSLISAIQEAFLQLGDSGFGGALKDLIQTATGTIRFFIGMQLEADKASVAVERLTQTVIFLTTAVAAFIAMKLPVHLMAAVKAVTALTFAMMKNPFGLAAVAIAAVITALVDVQNGMDGFLESVFRIADFVRATFSIVAETIQITFDGIFKHVKKGVDGLIKMVKTLTEVSGFKLDLSGVGAGLDEFLGGPGIRADAQFAIDEITKRANSYRDLRAAAREAAEQEEENANTAAENANKVADLSEEELQRIKDIQAANAEKAEEGERQIHAMFDDLRLERELLKLTNDEREREEELIAARRIANESGFDASEKLFMDLEADNDSEGTNRYGSNAIDNALADLEG